jgi:hypothetical protein
MCTGLGLAGVIVKATRDDDALTLSPRKAGQFLSSQRGWLSGAIRALIWVMEALAKKVIEGRDPTS